MRLLPLLLACMGLLVSCAGGGGDSGRDEGSGGADFGCDGSCAHLNLSIQDVETILSQAIGSAQAFAQAGTFAVVDRVGNVLAVYQMDGAAASATIDGQIGAMGGLEGISVPSTLAAISKAGTGAYLSSQGNAFSTRTASQIVQENFNPGEDNAPGGPLFGVQFSQLICSDITVRNPDVGLPIGSGSKAAASGHIGPRPLPLGLSADPGGIPLYKNGDVVGGLGVEIDGIYRLDRSIVDRDQDIDEIAAIAAAKGFEAPSERVAPNVFAGGKSLRFSDAPYGESGSAAGALDLDRLVSVPEFSAGVIREGATFGTAASGILNTVRAGVPSSALVFADGSPRYPTRSGSSLGGAELSAIEVDALLDSALTVAFKTRAAIRRPLDTPARVSIWVVDHAGVPLGFTRSQDAPIFGIDVSLQKARTAAFFSSSDAIEKLTQVRVRNAVGEFEDYGRAVSTFAPCIGQGAAVAARSIGNLARPFYPDGIVGNGAGPLSLPFPGTASGRSWSPFNTGLQLDLIFQRLVAPLGVPAAPSAIPDTCTDRSVLGLRLGNGIQIFPGAVPLYRDGTLIGALGISGDGIDQDDLTAFFGASRRGLDEAGHTDVGDPVLGFHAPASIRADTITVAFPDTRLRYVNCPEAPFIGSEEQNVCQ